MTNQNSFNIDRRIAMLIDGDNAQHNVIELMLEEASRYGTITIRRAYGDWTTPNLSKWRDVMLSHAIQPIQQWRYTVGKNATDSSLIIDAMDVLYSGTVQGFCIVSSDSDYTRLCTRIRESGLFVMGIGRKQTPEAFVKACDIFVYVENLEQSAPAAQLVKSPEAEKPVQPTETPKTTPAQNKTAPQPIKTAQPAKSAQPTKNKKPQQNNNAKLISLLTRAFDISEQDDEGWVGLGALGQALHKLDPSFDSRTYGQKTLSLLMKSLPNYVLVKSTKKTGASAIYVRLKTTK